MATSARWSPCANAGHPVPFSDAVGHSKNVYAEFYNGRGRCSGRARPDRIGRMTAPTTELMEFDDVIATYDPVLGMEVHVELGTATKMFCGCPTTFGAEPNTQVCPVCIRLPGSLPVANAAAIESAIRIGLALNCSIRPSRRLRAEELLLPRSAEELPDQPIRRADRI